MQNDQIHTIIQRQPTTIYIAQPYPCRDMYVLQLNDSPSYSAYAIDRLSLSSRPQYGEYLVCENRSDEISIVNLSISTRVNRFQQLINLIIRHFLPQIRQNIS